MEECRREGEWFVVGESAALIMMSALQFICYCHDKSWWWCGVCFDAFCENARWVGVCDVYMEAGPFGERRIVPGASFNTSTMRTDRCARSVGTACSTSDARVNNRPSARHFHFRWYPMTRDRPGVSHTRGGLVDLAGGLGRGAVSAGSRYISTLFRGWVLRISTLCGSGSSLPVGVV